MTKGLDRIIRAAAVEPFWQQVDMSAGPKACWPWMGAQDHHGYGLDGIYRAHRWAWQAFNGRPIEEAPVVMHTCDNPICCNPLHLVAGTQAQNTADRVYKDRSAKGDKNGRATLTDAQAIEVFLAEGSYAGIAARFAVSKWTVRDIKKGENRGWLTARYSRGGNSDGNKR